MAGCFEVARLPFSYLSTGLRMPAHPSVLTAPPLSMPNQAMHPWRRQARRFRYLPLPLLGLAYLFFVLNNGGPLFYRQHPFASLFDEGFQVTGAARILNGAVPYRDFWAPYAPGQYYMLAGLFKLFGTSLPVERLWDFFARALLSGAVYVLTAQLTSHRAAAITFTVVVLWVASCGFYGYVIFPTLAFSLISMICLLKSLGRKRPFWIISSGLLAGLTTVFRHDVGIYTVGAQAVVVAMFLLSGSVHPPGGMIARLAPLAQTFLAYAAAFAMPVLPTILYLFYSVPAEYLSLTFIKFPLTVSSGLGHLARPPLVPDLMAAISGGITWVTLMHFMISFWLPFYTPLALYCLGITATIILLLKSKASGGHDDRLWGLMLITIYGTALFNLALNRADTIHLLPTSITALVLTITLSSIGLRTSYWKRFTGSHRRRLIVRMSPVILFIIMASAYRPLLTGIHILGSARGQVTFALGPATPTIDATPDGQAEAILFIQDRVADYETIFVGNARNDRTTINDAMFYFLARRGNATRYDDLAFTGIDPLLLQEELVHDLETKATRYVVLFSEAFPRLMEWDRNGWGSGSGVTLLDEFIRDRYIQEAEFGDYTVWVKR
jgi:hypothetical protein